MLAGFRHVAISPELPSMAEMNTLRRRSLGNDVRPSEARMSE
jgi:hypothetical protein